MKKFVKILCILTIIMAILASVGICADEERKRIADYQVSGPFAHKNLSIFLIHGKDTIKGKEFITLEEALEKKIAILNETGSVNELNIVNRSKNLNIYVQSGDIVKGGKQDRVIAFDMIVPPKTDKMPVETFCVERDRWKERGKESVHKFSISSELLPAKSLKLATKSKSSQSRVWNEITKSQEKLSRKLGKSVHSEQSATSLQLSLENKKLKTAAGAYIRKLSPAIEHKGDVIGYAFAINGEFNSADIYGSNALFKKLWPKLIKSSAIEAIATFEKSKEARKPDIKDIEACITDALKGKKSEKNVTKGVMIITRESDRNYVFETHDMDAKKAVHINYIKK